MVIKRLSCVFRLSDAGSGRLLTRSEVSFREGGAVIKHEYKPGGYFVLTDLPEGDHTITVTAPGYQQEQAVITVDHSRFSALDSVSYVALNPSRRHPAADRYPSVCGSAPGFGTVYAVRAAGNLRVAEERSEAGASEVRMFQETGAPALPALFLLGSGKTSELVMFTGSRDGLCSVHSPLKYAHQRSETAQPLIRLRCGENGEFFLLLAGTFRPDAHTGNYRLSFIAEKSGKVVTAQAEAAPRGCTDIGKLKFAGGK